MIRANTRPPECDHAHCFTPSSWHIAVDGRERVLCGLHYDQAALALRLLGVPFDAREV